MIHTKLLISNANIVMMWFGLVLFLFVDTTLVQTQDPRSRWSRQFAPQNTARQKDSGPPGFPHPIPEQRQVDVVPLEKGPFNQQDVSGPGNFRSRVPRPSNGGQTQPFDSQSQGESGKTKMDPSGMRKRYFESVDASAGLPDSQAGQLDKRRADTFGGFRKNKREPYRGPQFEVQQQNSNQLDMGGNMGVSLDTQIEAPAQLLDALSPPTFDPSLLFGSNRPPSSGPVKSDQAQSNLSQDIKGLFKTRPGQVDASERNLRSRVPTDRSGPTQMNAAKPESMGSPPVDPGTIAQGLIDVMDQTQMRAGGQGEVMIEGEIQIPTAILKAAVGVLGGTDTSGSTATDGSQFSGIGPSNKGTGTAAQQRYDHSSQKSGFDGKLKRESSPQQGVADSSRPDFSRRPGSSDPQSASFDAFSRSERRPQGQFDLSRQQGGQSGFDQTGQQGGLGGFDPSGQQGGQSGFDPSGQQEGRPSFDRSGQQGEQLGFDPLGQQGGQPSFSRSGQQGGQPSFDRPGQQGGQPSFDRSGQQRGQHSFDRPGQQGGQPGFDPSGQQGGQPSFDPLGQQGGQPSFDRSGQQGGQPSFDRSGQQGGQPSFDRPGQQGGQPSFDRSGQQGGQPIFDRSGQQGGQAGFDPLGQQRGQPNFDQSGQQGGQPSFDPLGQQGGLAGFDSSGQQGGQSSFDTSGQQGFDPSIRKDSGKQSGFDVSAQPEYIQRGSVDPSGQSYVGDDIVDRKSGGLVTKSVGGDIIRPKGEQGFGQAPSMGAVKSNNVPRQTFVDTSRQDIKGQGGQSAADRLSALFGKCCFIIKKWIFLSFFLYWMVSFPIKGGLLFFPMLI